MLGGLALQAACLLGDAATGGAATPLALFGALNGLTVEMVGMKEIVDGFSTPDKINQEKRDEDFEIKTSALGFLSQQVGGDTAGKIGEYLSATIDLASTASKMIGGELTKVILTEFMNDSLQWELANSDLGEN